MYIIIIILIQLSYSISDIRYCIFCIEIYCILILIIINTSCYSIVMIYYFITIISIVNYLIVLGKVKFSSIKLVLLFISILLSLLISFTSFIFIIIIIKIITSIKIIIISFSFKEYFLVLYLVSSFGTCCTFLYKFLSVFDSSKGFN